MVVKINCKNVNFPSTPAMYVLTVMIVAQLDTTHLLHISDTVGMALHQSAVQHSFRGVSSFQLNTEYQWFMTHNQIIDNSDTLSVSLIHHRSSLKNTVTVLTLQELKCICTSYIYALLISPCQDANLT